MDNNIFIFDYEIEGISFVLDNNVETLLKIIDIFETVHSIPEVIRYRINNDKELSEEQLSVLSDVNYEIYKIGLDLGFDIEPTDVESFINIMQEVYMYFIGSRYRVPKRFNIDSGTYEDIVSAPQQSRGVEQFNIRYDWQVLVSDFKYICNINESDIYNLTIIEFVRCYQRCCDVSNSWLSVINESRNSNGRIYKGMDSKDESVLKYISAMYKVYPRKR
jgi:hypothetical protein